MSTRNLQKLLAWLSPAFPVGGFAWSAGLETMIAARRIHDRETTESWLSSSLAHGGPRNDAIVIAEAWRRSREPEALMDLADLHVALTPAAERIRETLTTGDAFRRAASVWDFGPPPALPDPCPYPVALGALAAAAELGAAETIAAFLVAWAQAQISVAVRLVPIGQADGLRVLVALEPAIAALADFAATSSLDDLGGIAYGADIAQMRHEALPVRIFRS
jgi:urease accessory protein